MRKLKLQVQMTVDGFIATLDGEMDWMVWDWSDKLIEYVKELSEPVDCIVLGRKLAEGFIPYWASNPQGEDAIGIDKMNNTPKVVFTRTLDKSDPKVLKWKNTTMAKGDLVDEIMKLKNQDGKDIIAYGGAGFVSELIKHGLIDEYHLFINPAVLGNGMTIFNELKSRQYLTLIESRSFDCGIVVLHYEPKRK
ncbi:MAG: dihydrofolate reductase family protein [Paludibacter sp.]|nr:dihydrofolate reductase family protein [Paludibacter sp.]